MTVMTIKSIRVYKKNLALTRPYTITYQTVSSVEAVFVEVELKNGIIGMGSANPSKEVVGEDVNDAYESLQSDGIQRLVGRPISEIFSMIDKVKRDYPHKPGTLAAMDIALHDAFCQYLNVPLASFYNRKIWKMPTSVTIGIKGVEATLEEATEYVDRHFKALKVKLGFNFEEDIERLVCLREKFGQRVTIRVDANQGYTVAQVRQFFKQIDSLDIELVEQPTLVGTEEEVRTLLPDIRRRLAADESLHDAEAAFRLAAHQIFGIFNIKMMKCGGISGALEIATIAQNSGIDLFWGCNDESIVSITAALHTAFSCANTRYIDLDGSLDLAEDVVKSGFILEDGYMSLPNLPGLGLVY